VFPAFASSLWQDFASPPLAQALPELLLQQDFESLVQAFPSPAKAVEVAKAKPAMATKVMIFFMVCF
jgi:hypothetical protein